MCSIAEDQHVQQMRKITQSRSAYRRWFPFPRLLTMFESTQLENKRLKTLQKVGRFLVPRFLFEKSVTLKKQLRQENICATSQDSTGPRQQKKLIEKKGATLLLFFNSVANLFLTWYSSSAAHAASSHYVNFIGTFRQLIWWWIAQMWRQQIDIYFELSLRKCLFSYNRSSANFYQSSEPRHRWNNISATLKWS